MAPDVKDMLEDASDFMEAGKFEKAWGLISKVLNEENNNPTALVAASDLMERQGLAPLSYQIARRVVEMYPKHPQGWLTLGKYCDTLWKVSESENAYNRALTLLPANDVYIKANVYNNLSALQCQIGDFKRAKINAERALKLEGDFLKAKHNLGISQLALKEWDQGWKNYEASVGSAHRMAWKYGEEEDWKGERGSVVIYGEQGIGDEICAASMIPDAIGRAEKVIIDCDSRLKNLFVRSFPLAKVYGTRTAKVLNWDEEDQKPDYSISAMQLGAIFRSSGEFDPKPYLTADHEQTLAWKALWASKGKPAVGVAWTGGVASTGAQFRAMHLDDLKPLFDLDCTFVSLQYKPTDTEGTPIVRYDRATIVDDYDLTAGLVSSLDAVVAVPTSVVHLAGALGIPTVAMKAQVSCWKYTAGLPFHPVHLIENSGSWKSTVQDATRKLRSILYE